MNCIIICRVNLVDEIHIVTKIFLDDNLEDMKKRMKQAKSLCIQAELDDSNIAKQYN